MQKHHRWQPVPDPTPRKWSKKSFGSNGLSERTGPVEQRAGRFAIMAGSISFLGHWPEHGVHRQ